MATTYEREVLKAARELRVAQAKHTKAFDAEAAAQQSLAKASDEVRQTRNLVEEKTKALRNAVLSK